MGNASLADVDDTAQNLAMAAGTAIASLSAVFFALHSVSVTQEEVAYGATVTFRDGECWFWTGDVGLTAEQFKNDLTDRFDRRRAIFIRHTADTPVRCVELAQRSATAAGFKKVATITDADAGPIGPPLHDR